MNQSLNETVDSVDPVTLHDTISNLKSSLREQTTKTERIEKDLSESRKSQSLAKKTIVVLEKKNESLTMLIESNKTFMANLKAEAGRVPALERSVKELKEKIQTLENVENVVKSSVSEVETMLKVNHSAKSLCTLVVSLKREQRSNDTKRNELRQLLKVSQTECADAKNIQRFAPAPT